MMHYNKHVSLERENSFTSNQNYVLQVNKIFVSGFDRQKLKEARLVHVFPSILLVCKHQFLNGTISLQSTTKAYSDFLICLDMCNLCEQNTHIVMFISNP